MTDCINNSTGLHKRTYLSKQEAKRTIKRTRMQSIKSCEPYRCPDCGKWHIGHYRKAVQVA